MTITINKTKNMAGINHTTQTCRIYIIKQYSASYTTTIT